MNDAFSDVLRLIRLQSCIYFLRDFRSPWGMRLDGGGVAQFHAVLRGQCVIEAAGRVFQGAPGDVFLFPKGEPHVIADSEGRDVVSGQDFMQSLRSDSPLFNNGTNVTRLLCGHYEYHHDIRHPLIEELPAVMHMKSFESSAPEMLGNVLPALIREINADHPGATAVIEKLAEILLVQMIRAHVIEEDLQTGFLVALCDNRLARAVKLIHRQPGSAISLNAMAAEAGMSRSAFALHFKTIVGMSPFAYVTLWRMCRAHDLLQVSALSVSQTAIRVGYDSEVAFSRAFKRHFGTSPGSVQRNTSADAHR